MSVLQCPQWLSPKVSGIVTSSNMQQVYGVGYMVSLLASASAMYSAVCVYSS